jgi:hypothetical protein
VGEVSDDKSLHNAERKSGDRERFLNQQARLVKLADVMERLAAKIDEQMQLSVSAQARL